MSIWVDANGWPVPPYLLLGCLALELLYFRGWSMITGGIQARESFRASGQQRSDVPAPGLCLWQLWLWRAAFFTGALLALLMTSATPVDILAGRLLWVHMVQHIFLLGVIPPLLLAGAPLLPLWLGLPRPGRRLFKRMVSLRVRRASYATGSWLLHQPSLALLCFCAGIWLWHWPTLYDLALTNAAVHDWLEHTTFLLVSLLFWAQIIPSPPLQIRAGYLARLAIVGLAVLQNVALAAVLGFAQSPAYAPYAHLNLGPGSLTALQDQHLGAGIMWTFGDLPFGIALSALLHRWLSTQLGIDGEVELREQQRA